MEKAENTQPGGRFPTSAISVAMSSGAPQGMPMQSCTSTGSSITPWSRSHFASTRCPVSKTSISGRTPSACTCRAISRSIEGVLVIT